MISALLVTAVLLLAAALIRIFVIPKFRYMPGMEMGRENSLSAFPMPFTPFPAMPPETITR